MTTPPDPSASRAVFIGAGSYETLDDLPAAERSAQALATLFTQPHTWALPADHCRVVINPQTPRQLSKPVADAAQDATDALIVYYVGHGLIESRTGQLCLAVGDSDRASVHDTAAPFEWIRRSIEHSPAVRKIIIVDCCYSARAFGVQAAEVVLEVEGTYLLAASAENSVALAPPGEQYTAFTGELIRLIDDGVLDGGEFLDLDTIYRKLRLELSIKARPEPHRLCRNHLGGVAFVRNTAYEPPSAPRSDWRSWSAAQPAGGAAAGPTESEPYVRLASLRSLLDQLIQQVSPTHSLADTLQAITDGVVAGLGYELVALNLVRPDGDLVVAALAGNAAAEALMTGRVGSRAAWERRLSMGEAWGTLRFIPHTEGWVLDSDDVPQWKSEGPEPQHSNGWHPDDRLFAPMYSAGGKDFGDLVGVISVDQPPNGRRPGAWGREALQVYAAHAAVAISNARLRANMQRALVRLEREQQALRASEESFRQAFEWTLSPFLIAASSGLGEETLTQEASEASAGDVDRCLVGGHAEAFVQLTGPELLIGMLVEGAHDGLVGGVRLGRCGLA